MAYTKNIVFLTILLLVTIKVTQAQLVLNEDYLKEINKVEDSSSNFRYFSKLDTKIEQRIDSFISLIAKTKSTNKKGKTNQNIDKGYLRINFYVPHNEDYYTMNVKLANTYDEYSSYTRAKYYNNRCFGFMRYKGFLLLFELNYTKFKMKNDLLPLISDLLYPEFTKEVQREIIEKPEAIEVTFNAVLKRYKIKFDK